jgi:CHAD domain-containing protein
MAHANSSMHPVVALRNGMASLEAAFLLCLALPGKNAVHQLRSATRRIEAQLELFAFLPELPPHGQQVRRLRRLLKKLRRAAGSVRDLDVQRTLIREEIKRAAMGRAARKEARHLRRELKARRKEAAANLQKLLHRHRARLPLLWEDLLEALAPEESITLSEARLTRMIREWYRNDLPAELQGGKAFHRIRKRAKLARYLAESAPEPALAARRLAKRFEAIQQTGGTWHDWLLLTHISRGELTASAELTRRFAAKIQPALQEFRRQLRYRI